MDDVERKRTLREIARSLIRSEPLYCGAFKNEEHLMAWLNDRTPEHNVLCAYCDLPLLSSSSTSFRNGTDDHLLPDTPYKWLAAAQSNWVPCCYRCNNIKSKWDPNRENPIYVRERDGDVLTEDKRKELIKRSREYLRTKLEKDHAKVWPQWVKACEQLDAVEFPMVKIIRCESCKALFKVEGPAEAGNEAPILVSCPFCVHPNTIDWPLGARYSVTPDDETDAAPPNFTARKMRAS